MVPAFLGEDMTLICRKMSNCNLLCYSRSGSIIKENVCVLTVRFVVFKRTTVRFLLCIVKH